MRSFFTSFRGILILLFLTATLSYAQLQPVQNIPLNGSSVYSSSTYIAWYFNGYEAGITVELQVSTSSDMSSPIVDVTGLTGLTYNVSGLTEGTDYYWRIRSKSSGGAYSSWSSTWSFTVSSYYNGGGTVSVPVPQLNIPLDSSTVASSSVDLTWYLNSSSAGLTYHIQVSTSSDFSSFFIDDSGTTNLFYSLSGLLDGESYYWRVRSKNGSGVKSSWSNIFSFSVEINNTATYAPTLYSPSNDTTGFSYHPTLVWHSVSGAFSYSLEVSTDSTFSSVDRSYSGLTDTSKHIHFPKGTEYLELNTKYFWRVKAVTILGESSWSPVWNFTTKPTPDAPTLISPEDDEILKYEAVTLTWSDVVKDTGYVVEIYTDTTASYVDSVFASDTSYTSHLIAATEYFWKVKALSATGSSDFSGFWSFTTGNYSYWYVDTTGSDSNPGYLPESPLLTIQAAIDSADDGDKIIVGNGTYNQSLVIDKGVELSSNAGADSTVIYGQSDYAVVIGADGVTIDGFSITNPDGKYGLYSSDYSGIIIQNNIFTGIGSSDLSVSIINYGIAIVSSSSAVDSISIINNTITGINGGTGKKTVAGIVAGWSGGSETITNLVIDGNSITNIVPSDSIWGAYGILVNHEISGAQIINNTISDINGYWVHGIGLEANTPNAIITGNTFSNFTAVKTFDQYALFFENNLSLGTVSFNNNNVTTVYGLGIHSDLLALLTTEVVDAENNWWGDNSGPSGNGLTGTGAAFGTEDTLTDITAYVDYIPWLGGTPTLSIEDDSTTTGGTVSLDISANLFSDSLNYTFIGQFSYDETKLDFLSGMVGSGTILNASGWSVIFYESTPGVVAFIGYGFTPVSGSGKLFTLSFQVIAGTAGSATVSGSYSDFLADGVNLFGTSGSCEGEVVYSGTPSTLAGDADLSGDVDYDDITLMAQHITGAITLTGQAFTNADVDADSTIDADDIFLIVNYLIYGAWSVTPSVASTSGVVFNQAEEDNAGQILLPFSLDNVSSGSKVTSLELTIHYDESELEFQSFKGIDEDGVFVNASKTGDGTAKFVFASADGIENTKEIGGFLLKKNAAEATSEITSEYRVNDGDLQTGPTYSMNNVTDVEDEELPTKFELTQNYPNPFNPSTTINYSLPEAAHVTIKIYNILGQEIKTIVSKDMMRGSYSVMWNGVNNHGQRVASGTYIYRIVAGNFVETKKMMLLK